MAGSVDRRSAAPLWTPGERMPWVGDPASLPPGLRGALRGDASVPAHDVVGGNAVEFHGELDPWLERVVDDIGRARHTVNIGMFAWTEDGAGGEVADVARWQAKRGVEVNAILDGVGGNGYGALMKEQWRPQFRALVDGLRRDGVDARVNWRTRIGGHGMSAEATRALDHRKFFGIDGTISHVGGRNIVAGWDGWVDSMVRIEGPGSARAGAQYVGRWVDVGGVPSRRLIGVLADAYRSGQHFGTANVEILAANPGLEGNRLADSVRRDMQTGTGRLWASTPSLGDRVFTQDLAEAARSGRDTRLMLPNHAARDGDHVSRLISGTFEADLLDAGVDVRETTGTVHAKLVLANGVPVEGGGVEDALTVSSLNLNRRSRLHDFELGARITNDPKAIADAEAFFTQHGTVSLDAAGDTARLYRILRPIRQGLNARF